ncbi:MAG: HipA domain-containing protein [Acidipropionibacterium sp.]|jgi:serine/threonine-protein kinase HipA|nr:HipA domain-containing protein [Acidipropionibacterium sp.]
MSDVLDVWRDGVVVAHLTRTLGKKWSVIGCEYTNEATAPLSLSLPLDGTATKRAAASFIDNLLPDNPRIRASWAARLGVPDTSFDLLGEMGEDVAGALIIVPEDRQPSTELAQTQRADDDEIADRIMRIASDRDAWLAPERIGTTRMSLAGTQGKFTLARFHDRWFWPSAALPSTHILKPPPKGEFPGLVELEAGSLELARRVGLDAPVATVESFRSQKVYSVERFDRVTDEQGITHRVATEDLAQAMGMHSHEKYHAGVPQVVRLLAAHCEEEQSYVFMRMLAFHTVTGNADAHLKNYSVMLDGPVRLAPVYDTMPNMIWPGLSQKLAMKIGHAVNPAAVQEGNWTKMAQSVHLDPGRVLDIVRDVSTIVAAQAHDVYQEYGVPDRELAAVDRLVEKTTSRLRRNHA